MASQGLSEREPGRPATAMRDTASGMTARLESALLPFASGWRIVDSGNGFGCLMQISLIRLRSGRLAHATESRSRMVTVARFSTCGTAE
jgi:hypothetical protein